MKPKDKTLNYTTIHHDIRKKLDISLLEYCILDSIFRTQKNGYSWMSKDYLAKWIGVSERTIFDCIKRLETKGYIERSSNGRLIKTLEVASESLLYGNYEESSDLKDETMKKVHTNVEESSYNNNIYNNILSNDNIIIDKSIIEHIEKKELNSSDIKKQRSLIISSALITFKKEVEKRKGAGGQPMVFVRNNKMDRVNISNLLRNEVVKQILDKKSFDLSTFITKIFEMADKLEWWKTHPMDNTSVFYANYIKIMNQSKGSLTAVPKTITEQERKAFLADF